MQHAGYFSLLKLSENRSEEQAWARALKGQRAGDRRFTEGIKAAKGFL